MVHIGTNRIGLDATAWTDGRCGWAAASLQACERSLRQGAFSCRMTTLVLFACPVTGQDLEFLPGRDSQARTRLEPGSAGDRPELPQAGQSRPKQAKARKFLD